MVVDHTHLDALAGLGYECIGNKTSQCVVLEDVHTHMYMAAG